MGGKKGVRVKRREKQDNDLVTQVTMFWVEENYHGSSVAGEKGKEHDLSLLSFLRSEKGWEWEGMLVFIGILFVLRSVPLWKGWGKLA